MHRLWVFAVVAAALPAQRTTTSPPGWEGLESLSPAAMSAHPFFAANTRAQYVDSGLRGAPIAGISKLELRRDGQTPQGAYPARTTNLKLQLAHADMAGLVTLFANNAIGAPTVVVARKQVSLPDLSARGPSPSPWSIALPFDAGQSFSYDGTHDLLVEFQCDGTTPADREWPLECVDSSAPGVGQVALLDPFGYCLTLNGPFWLFVRPPETSAAGGVTLRLFARGGPSSAAGALGLGLADPGLGGLLCNALRTSADVLLPFTVSATGDVGTALTPLVIAAPFAGALELYVQMAALDPWQAPKPQVALSDASRARIVAPTSAVGVQRLLAASSTVAPGSLATGVRSPLLGLVMRLTHP